MSGQPPKRMCPDCGGLRYYKAKRCKKCHDATLRLKWRVTEISDPGVGHQRAQKLYRDLGTCEYDGCEKPACDRHHIDEDTTNNERENLMFLCRRHHMMVDGRLEAVAARASEAGRLGGNPTGRVNPERDPRGRFLGGRQ